MDAVGGRVAHRLAIQGGYALPELLVATVIALLVAAGGMIVLQTAVRSQPKVSERAAQIQQGRTLIETISRELRQGDSVEVATPSGLEIHTYVNSATCGGPPATTARACWVTYSCEGTACWRTEHDGSGVGSTREVVDGLLAPDVFCYAPHREEQSCPASTSVDPSYVGVTLSFPTSGGSEAITLRDGVALRNHSPPPEPPE